MTIPAGEGFPRTARIRSRREYLSLGRTGTRCQTRHFVILAKPRAGGSRLGVTVSRKIGGAVARNLVKRRVREAFRRHPARLLADHDLVVIARSGAPSISAREVVLELDTALKAKAARQPGLRS